MPPNAITQMQFSLGSPQSSHKDEHQVMRGVGRMFLNSRVCAQVFALQESGQGRPQGLFIIPPPKTNCYPLFSATAGALDRCVSNQTPALDWPNGRILMFCRCQACVRCPSPAHTIHVWWVQRSKLHICNLSAWMVRCPGLVPHRTRSMSTPALLHALC